MMNRTLRNKKNTELKACIPKRKDLDKSSPIKIVKATVNINGVGKLHIDHVDIGKFNQLKELNKKLLNSKPVLIAKADNRKDDVQLSIERSNELLNKMRKKFSY